MAVDDDGPVAEITLERYRLKELRADVAARLEQRLRADDQLRRRVDALALSDEQIRTSDRLELVAARVRHRLGAERTDAERRAWTSKARWALPAAVAAGVALMVLLPWTTFVPAGGDERIKGLDASLTLFRQAGAGSETLADGAVARQGDVIRVGYHAAGRAYGVILSIDGRGHVTVHLPRGGDRAITLGREPTVLLDQAFELDDAPRWERFYFITGDGPFPIAPIVASVQRAVAQADGTAGGDAIPARAPRRRPSAVSLFASEREHPMIRPGCLSLSCSLLVFAATAVEADTPLQRYTLIVGANFGGADRPLLKYGVSDAERFARVMVDLGGVSPEHNTILKQPKLRDLLDGLDLLTRRVADAARLAGPGAGRIEVIVYYSGHADEKGLLLGEDRYSYRSLRDRLDQIPADVRIAVLDACASGAFTRIKGGRARPPFLVDQSASMRGHAILTSSAATEVAQESDRIRASYFTHYLISGLRGAADMSGDGRITLNEAYQFAFSETLGRTVDSKGGAQHPSYDINMSGTGDVVMTDVRQLSATLVLGQEVEGRFFVRNAAQELIVEVYKPYGRTVALGVEPGTYEVRVERDKTALLAKVSVADGGQLVVDRRQFNPTTVEVTRSRGPADVPLYAVQGRNRLDLRLGMWRTDVNGTVSSGVSTGDLVGGLQYTRYLKENLSITFAVEGLEVEVDSGAGPAGAFSSVTSIASLPVGVRWNPFSFGRASDGIKPFVAVGIGPVIGESVGTHAGSGSVSTGARTSATVGTYLRGGADFHFARSFTIAVDGGYNWVADFAQPVGARRDYSGFSLGLGLGWLFGAGTAAQP